MSEEAYLDVSLIRCPRCGKLYVDASWYILDMESDIECGVCGSEFNTRKNIVRRLMLKISFDYENNLRISYKDLGKD
ncbi:TPA: hypothetical protein EYP83_03210 [Candidatus Geothermarchaeota archaeon]|nr:hypothetical protein [Candidatus Geothermarchaeota archaeon]HIQ13448.1 hypothetical protein [Thermoprotei archaeon]